MVSQDGSSLASLVIHLCLRALSSNSCIQQGHSNDSCILKGSDVEVAVEKKEEAVQDHVVQRQGGRSSASGVLCLSDVVILQLFFGTLLCKDQFT